MSQDHRLIDLIVCPLCKGRLVALRDGPAAGPLSALACKADRLAFPIRDGIPILLEHEARALSAEEAQAL